MIGVPLTEQAAIASLQIAMKERSIPKLKRSIAECKKLKFSPPELAQAQQRLPQLEVRVDISLGGPCHVP